MGFELYCGRCAERYEDPGELRARMTGPLYMRDVVDLPDGWLNLDDHIICPACAEEFMRFIHGAQLAAIELEEQAQRDAEAAAAGAPVCCGYPVPEPLPPEPAIESPRKINGVPEAPSGAMVEDIPF